MLRKYLILLIIAIAVLLVISILGGVYLYFCKLPEGCDTLEFMIDCMQLKDNNDLEWSGYLDNTLYMKKNSSGVIADHDGYIRYIMFLLRTLSADETTDEIKDVQIVKFDFRDSNWQSLITYHIAYDFYQCKLYLLKDNVWYEIEESKLLNNVIQTLIDTSDIYPLALDWRGQSIYAKEEFVIKNFDEASFRYNLYWAPSRDLVDFEEYDYRDSGFNNRDICKIDDEESAIKRAVQELGYDKYRAFAFFDETCGYWMIELFEEQGSEVDTHFVFENAYTVIIDNQGRTLEVYRECTSFSQFFVNRGDGSSY